MERNTDELRTLGRKKVFLSGCFRPNGTGDPLDASVQGGSVARTGVGTFEVTYQDTFGALLGGDAALQGGSAGDIRARLISWTQATKKVVIQLYDINADVAVDEADDAQRVVRFYLVVDDKLDA